MADYNGFLRFSDEAVASVNWNDQQHSGEAGVTDEKTGTVYPFGGGGGDSDFKINNVTFVCDPNTTQSSSLTGGRLDGMIIDEEDNMYYITGAQILITEETAYKLVSYKNHTYFTIEPENGITFTNVTVTSGECDIEFDDVYYINAKSDAVITIEWQETV